MANTYSQIYIQVVFTVRGRQNLIAAQYREELQDIKAGSSGFINNQQWIKSKFNWQEACLQEPLRQRQGFGAFSYSHSQIKNVIAYILNQEKHHQRKSFKEEYHEFLEKFQVDFNHKYLFDWVEN